MYRLIRMIGLTVSTLLMITTVSAQQATPTPLLPATIPDEFTTRTDPASLVGAYYNAISRDDFARAYGYWERAPGNQTEAQFAAGFADTLNVSALVRLPIFEDAGAGNVFANLPTLVIAERIDGSTVYFAGCFAAHKTNVPVGNATEPDPNWYLQKGNLTQIQSLDFTVLDAACNPEYALTDNPNFTGVMLTPIQLIESYFTLIVEGKAVDASGLWEHPDGDLFLNAYAREIRSAISINVYVDPVIYGEGAAGSIYTSIPALVTAKVTDSSTLYFPGCYVARLSNVPVGDAETPDPNWHFYNATLSLANDAPSAVAALTQSCVGRG
jgi:hypothetical protein